MVPVPASLLCLGDSYTIGEGVDAAGRWPQQLVAALAQQGIAVAPPQVIATTGWTTDELAAGIAAAAPQGPFDLVSLAIGVNNQYRLRSLGEYAVQFGQLLATATALAGGHGRRVLVLAIPDWSVTPFAAQGDHDRATTAAQLDAFNRVACEQAHENGSPFVDIAPLYRAHAAQPGMLADDGLHPSAAMYALWVAQLLPHACRCLQR